MPSEKARRTWILLLLVLLWGSLGYAALQALFDWPLFVHTPLGKWLSLGALGLVVEQPAVAIITDSLVSFLLGWGGRYVNTGDEVDRGVGVLCLAVTGDPHLLPGGATLEDDHIAELLSWALMEELEC